jgi:ribose/xylose/arabinose/galactoside ABC-type transport system permease subunit
MVERLARYGPQVLGIGGFYLAALVFFAFSAHNFFTTSNTVNILSTVSVIGVVSLGQALVLISGGFDLSVSGAVPLGGIIYVVASNAGHPMVVALALALLAGAGVGLVNGLIITRIGINPLVTTLATLSITTGLAFTVAKGLTIALENPDAAPLGNEVGGMPLYVWTLIALSIVAFLILRYTIFGRMLYSLGGNREAARLAGLRVDLITVSVYVISATLATFAGVLLAQQLLAGAPTVGADAALSSIAAVILGGASLSGGSGGVPGTLLGVLILGTVSNGMALLQVPAFYQQIATGVILLMAVGLGSLRGAVQHAVLKRQAGDRDVRAAERDESEISGARRPQTIETSGESK